MKKILIPILAISISFLIMIYKGTYAWMPAALTVFGLLLVFTLVSKLLALNKSAGAEEIAQRTISWWWMVAIFMVAVTTFRAVTFCFLGLLCFFTLREYFSLMPNKLTVPGKGFSSSFAQCACYSAIFVSAYIAYIKWYGLYIIIVPVYAFLLIPIIFVLEDRTKGVIESLGFMAIGLIFFVFNFGHSFFMVNIGASVLVYCFLLTQARDVLAYFVGNLLRIIEEKYKSGFVFKILNKKIAQSINPKKTWATGLITAFIISGISLLFVPIFPEFPKGKITYLFAAVLGFSIGIFGLMGDLVFSMIKRDIGIKDTGDILPGHGGLIDRVNSLVFTVPIVFHLINWKYI